ncbi:uncharacterized protein GHT09_004132 [Marmota monax]|uniref:Uncharacterized protein n=1 Tax=Marmota monax TaxID=9995 RepID=A0A834UN58_MARMO|nr:uncharacterized protein GHT09_004132 [Marmota monax]
MSKRKKLRTSGEGVRPPKPPKNPRLGHSKGGPESPDSGHLHHPEESEDSSGPVAFTELTGEEPGGAVSSSPHEETGAASRLLGQPEKEPIPLPPSQNSVGRFVPQFAKPRKTGTRKAETREEDPENGAVSSDTLPVPSAQQAGSLLLQESLGLALQEARGPGEQTQADSPCSEQSGQNLETPVPGRGDSQSLFSSEVGTGPSHPERASQNRLLEQSNSMMAGGNLGNRRPEAEMAWVLGDRGQKGHLPGSDAGGQGPDRGAPPGGGAQGGSGAELPWVPRDEGASRPHTAAPAPAVGLAQELSLTTPHLKTWNVGQDLPDPRQIPGGSGGEAGQSHSSPGCTSLSADPTEMDQRTPEVAGPGGQAFPSRQAPGRGCSAAELDCAPLAEDTTAGRGDLGLEGGPQGDMSSSPLGFLAPASGNQTPSVGAKDSGHLALEMGPDVGQVPRPSPVQEGPGRMCTQPVDRRAAGLGSQGREQVLKELSLSPGASGLLELRDTVGDPPPETGVPLGSPEPSAEAAGQPQHPPASSDLELGFLPDSQIREALEGAGFEAPPEQVSPAGSESGLCWPDPSPRARVDLVMVAQVQPRPGVGVQAPEAPRMEDATGTVQGLVVELSNLNRLIMSAHRDLEAFRRLHSRKAKPPGKAPSLYPPKESLSRGEQAWRDL